MCDLPHDSGCGSVIADAPVVTETIKPEEVTMSSLKTLAVVTLLIASVSTAFAQRAPVAQGSGQPTTETHSGPFSNMNRPE